MNHHVTSAPIRAGEASPLRVATSDEASDGSQAPRRCSLARPNRRRDHATGSPGKSSPLRGSEFERQMKPQT